MNVFNTELKQTFRAHIIFEQITGETFTGKNLTQVITFFYSTIMACNPDLDLEFDAFIDYLDEHPDTITDFTNWLVSQDKKNAALNPKETKETEKKPTAKKKK